MIFKRQHSVFSSNATIASLGKIGISWVLRSGLPFGSSFGPPRARSQATDRALDPLYPNGYAAPSEGQDFDEPRRFFLGVQQTGPGD
jgi:hypothetical protein